MDSTIAAINSRTLIGRRLLILLSRRSRVEEDKATALAVTDTNDSAQCVYNSVWDCCGEYAEKAKEQYKESASKFEASDDPYKDVREQTPHARVSIENSGEQTIQIDEIHQYGFEYPLDSAELLVTTLLGDPLNTDIVELTSDNLK